MSRIESIRRGLIAAPIALVLVLASTDHVSAQPPHAVDPLPNPYFSIDPLSPTAATGNVSPSDVLDKPGPTPVIPRVGLGLTHPLDNLDALSGNRSELAVSGASPTFAILFSVDRASIGAAAPDPALVAANRPFNMKDQAAKRQAPADLFMSTLAFDLNGPILPPLRSSGGNNTEVINQGDAGGVDYDLKPKKSASESVDALEPLDDVDAISEKESSGGVAHGNDSLFVFFSVSRNSPSLENLPGVPSGANIYLDLQPTAPGTEILFLSAQQLGLVPGVAGDDIDGLVVADNGDFEFDEGVDRVFFTLTRNSPSLGNNSAADIFVYTGVGPPTVFALAGDLGLAATDHIDALEILMTDDVEASAFAHALLQILPGDHDDDGDLDQLDCDGFHDCFRGAGVPFDSNGQANVTISVGPGPQFIPPAVTIETGDRVTWVWAGAFANVVSGVFGDPDGAFHSGSPTSVTGSMFAVDFDDAFVDLYRRPGGVYHYFSQTVPPPNSMDGSITVAPHACATYDFDYDGDVDCADWRAFRRLYTDLNGALCLPLTIEQFVAALIDQPFAPYHVCLADMNGDNAANGMDVKPYVDAYLAAP